nr:hypothetical protein [Anaerolineae bacterium]
PLENTLVSLEQDSTVLTYQIKSLLGIRLLDPRASHDLRFFLDSSMSEDMRRTLTIRLSKADTHDLIVSYVAPSPTWRVSYRIVAESEEGQRRGSALLQGWGLFDNRLDEDLTDVAVTLVAGQPISFIYDLYSSKIPDRPVVEDEARTAPGPVEFRAESPKRARRPAPAAMMAGAVMAKAAPEEYLMAEAEPSMMDMAGSIQAAAEGRESGEFFQYVVTNPVSVRRGESALVPIIGTEVSYNRELLYNGHKLPDHPVAALRFINTSGLTFERGPVTIVVDNEYKGEAIVPFTRAESEVYLAYAVELGIRITERSEDFTEMAGIDIRGEYLLINEYLTQVTTYTIENETARDEVVTIESPIMTGFELVHTPDPDAQTATERRWEVPVLAYDTAAFIRTERRLTMRHEQIRGMKARHLKRYFEGEWLDENAFRALEAILEMLALIEKSHQEIAQLEQERQTVYARQQQLRENLNTLTGRGEEAALRGRMLKQLEAAEDRVLGIETRSEELKRLIEETEKQIDEAIRALGDR